MDFLQAIRYINQSLNDVTIETINNCWHHTGILPDNETDDIIHKTDDIIHETDVLTLDELFKTLEAFHLPDVMQVKEFLNLPDEKIVYEVLDDDKIIIELVDIFKKRSNENIDDLDEIDDSTEMVVINTSVALKSLETVNAFLLQQENANEYVKLVNTIERFIRNKKQILCSKLQ